MYFLPFRHCWKEVAFQCSFSVLSRSDSASQLEYIFIWGHDVKFKHFYSVSLTVSNTDCTNLLNFTFHYINALIYCLHFIEPFQWNWLNFLQHFILEMFNFWVYILHCCSVWKFKKLKNRKTYQTSLYIKTSLQNVSCRA